MSAHSDLRHGGALDAMRARFADAPEPWLDLSTGINPWPYPLGRIDTGPLAALPDAAAFASCRDAMAACFAAQPGHVLPAPGSEMLIRLLPTILNPARAAIAAPSYGDHAEVWQAAGVPAQAVSDPLAHAGDADLLVLCNPNNPDGRCWAPDALTAAAAAQAARGKWLVVDEAFADLDPARSLAPQGGMPGLIVLRSFGKFFGLPGLRLGALIAPASVTAAMAARLGDWAVAAPALAAGTDAYRDHAWQSATRARLAQQRQHLDSVLTSAGLEIAGGTDLFRYVICEDAHRLWAHLGENGIYVRRFLWSDRHLRIGLPPDKAALHRLGAALTGYV